VSNYVPSTNFATKDNLPSGDPLKIVKGTEINTEFANIAIAVATKADLASPTFTGTPAAPTASPGTNTTQLATTAFVAAATSTLGTMSTQNANNVNITGGAITGATLNASNLTSGTTAVARGGTGANTLAANNVILGNGTSAVQTVAPSTSGNVLTSNGSTWASAALPAPTTNQVLTAIASASLGAVGTYAFAATNGEGGEAAGRVVSGSSLTYAGGGNDSNSGNQSVFEASGSLSGSWMQMGYQKSYQTSLKATLWLRVS
jgi:hypothetical protein